MLLLAWLSVAAAAPRCDVSELTELRAMLPTLDAEQRTMISAAALSELCKLPKPVRESLDGLQSAPPSMAGVMDMQLVLASPGDWTKACDGGIATAQAVAEVARGEVHTTLWQGCGGASRGWMDSESWSGAQGLVFAPILAHYWLRESGVSEEVTRAYVRALAGLEDEQTLAKEAAKVREFEPLYP